LFVPPSEAGERGNGQRGTGTGTGTWTDGGRDCGLRIVETGRLGWGQCAKPGASMPGSGGKLPKLLALSVGDGPWASGNAPTCSEGLHCGTVGYGYGYVSVIALSLLPRRLFSAFKTLVLLDDSPSSSWDGCVCWLVVAGWRALRHTLFSPLILSFPSFFFFFFGFSPIPRSGCLLQTIDSLLQASRRKGGRQGLHVRCAGGSMAPDRVVCLPLGAIPAYEKRGLPQLFDFNRRCR